MKIEFDYSLDVNGFFDAPERREALEFAGNIWANLLQDDFEEIPIGAEFTVTNPSTGNPETIILDREIDDLLIFVGGGSLDNDGNNLQANLKTDSYHLQACSCCNCNLAKGEALRDPSKTKTNKIVNLSQPGVLDTENVLETDSLLAQAQVNGTDLQGDIFQRRVTTNFRDTGVVTDFEPWAGTISFSPSDSVDWNFDLENTDSSTIDFISVALHEIGHILGIGVAPIFDEIGNGGTFAGLNALAVSEGAGIPLESDLSHVAEGFSGNSVLLDPLLNENRSLPSNFDLALLADIGYEIAGFSKQGFIPDFATNESEEIIGTYLDDEINGLAGSDLIQGNDGNDTITGGVGDDTIFGMAEEDFLVGNDGADSLHGGLGKDTIDGGSDNDLLVGAENDDVIMGRDGNDELQGNGGADTIQGGAGSDSLFGQENPDLLLGNGGSDNIQGGFGDDSILGNESNDLLFGQQGNDILDGGLGDDTLVGGSESDRFFFDLDNGNDTINDFTIAEDIIEISANLGLSNGNDVLAAITNSGVTVEPDGLFSEITFSQGNTVSIFHDSDLTADNFAIVTESSIGAVSLNVVEVKASSSLIEIEFDNRLNADVLDLADLALVSDGAKSAIAGSLIWQEDNLTLSFIPTDLIPAGDLYNLTLISNANGFVSETGVLLDGDADDMEGGNFVTQLTIEETNQRVLALGDFNLATGENTSLDISIDNGVDLTKAEFSITYNADILNIDDIVLNSELANDWAITIENLNTPGIAILTVEGTTPLDSGAIDLVQLQASIPSNATYGVSDLIQIDVINLNEGNIDGIGDTATQTVTLTGDVDGNGSYSNLDSYAISQFSVGLTDNFNAFPTINPTSIADINQDGFVSALDSFLVAQR